MAGRGGSQIKDDREQITSIKDWLQFLASPRVLVVEIFNSTFGPCTSILPAMQNIMLQIDDAPSKVQWAVMNAAKIVQDTRHQMLEDSKKKRDMDDIQKRKMEMERLADEDNKSRTGGLGGALGGLGGAGKNALLDAGKRGPQTSASASAANASALASSLDSDDLAKSYLADPLKLDSVVIPKLEKYSNYDSPRPLFLIFQDGDIKYEVSYPNPPKLAAIVLGLVNKNPPGPATLDAMDFHPDPNRVRRRKSKRRLAQEEEAKRKAREAKERLMQEPEQVVQLFLSVALQDHFKADSKANHFPVVAAYARNPITGEFDVFVGATERNKTPNSPIFTTPFVFDPAVLGVAAAAELGVPTISFAEGTEGAGVDTASTLPPGTASTKPALPPEYRLVVYDLDEDVDLATVAKSAPERLSMALSGSVIIDLAQVVQITKDKTGPDGSVVANASPAFAAYELEPSKRLEMGASPGTLLCNARLTQLHGKRTRLRIQVSCTNLPSNEPMGRIDPIVAVSVQDANHISFVPLGTTEVKRGATSPSFAQGIIVDHYEKMDRTLKLAVYDSDAFDPTIPAKGLLGWVALPLSAFAVTVSEPNPAAPLGPDGQPLPNADGSPNVVTSVVALPQMPVGSRSDLLQVPLRNVQNEPIGEQVYLSVDAIHWLPRRPPFQPDDMNDRLRINLRATGLRRPDWHGAAAPMVAFYARNMDTLQYDQLIGLTERLTGPLEPLLPLYFAKDVLVEAPADEDDAKASVRVAVFDVLPQQEAMPEQGVLLGECIVDLFALARDPSGQADMMLVDSSGTVVPRAQLHVSTQLAGVVYHAELAMEAFNLPPSPTNPDKCDAVLVCYRVDANGAYTTRVGITEVKAGERDPAFATMFPLHVYSKAPETLRIALYDVADPADPQWEKTLDDVDLLGECFFTVTEHKEREVLLPLKRNGEEVKDAVLKLTVLPVAPQPDPALVAHAEAEAAAEAAAAEAAALASAALKKSGSGAAPSSSLEPRPPSASSASAAPAASSTVPAHGADPSSDVAAAAAAAAAPVAPPAIALTPEQAVATAQDVTFTISCRNLPRAGGKPLPDPLLVVYRKDRDNSGAYSIFLQTACLPQQANPDFDRVVTLPFDPAFANVCRFTVFDLNNDEYRVTEQDIICSAKVDIRELVHSAAAQGGLASGANACVQYVQPLLSPAGQPVVNDEGVASSLVLNVLNVAEAARRIAEAEAHAHAQAHGAAGASADATAHPATAGEVSGTSANPEASAASVSTGEHAGALNTSRVAFHVACRSLPTLAGRAHVNPIAVLYRQDAADPANLVLAGKTDLFNTEPNPVFPNAFAMDLLPAGANTFRFSIFSVEDPSNVTDQDLLAMADVDIAQLAKHYREEHDQHPQAVELVTQLVLPDGAPARNAAGEESLLIIKPIAVAAAAVVAGSVTETSSAAPAGAAEPAAVPAEASAPAAVEALAEIAPMQLHPTSEAAGPAAQAESAPHAAPPPAHEESSGPAAHAVPTTETPAATEAPAAVEAPVAAEVPTSEAAPEAAPADHVAVPGEAAAPAVVS